MFKTLSLGNEDKPSTEHLLNKIEEQNKISNKNKDEILEKFQNTITN